MSLVFNILVIDDEPVMRDSCFQVLSRKGCDVTLTENGRRGLNQLSKRTFDIVILDLKMPDINGLEILETVKENHPETIVIIITGYPSVETAVKAMKLGAYDFIPKPFTPNMLRMVVARALEKRRLYSENLPAEKGADTSDGNDAIIGESKVITYLKQFIKKASLSDCSVLITGETGTGKELVARALHYHSLRKANRFVTVDSGGLVDTLIESELFGHVRGAFTGAVSERIGRFEMANRGTLFFDEISNMNFRIQCKLLRAIQEQEITRVGTSYSIPIDVRIITATNRNLKAEIKRGDFREDLFYRLNVIPIHLPSLRERTEDIPTLANYYFNRFKENKTIPYPEKISDEAMEAMIQYDWPGNVRELEHIIKRAVALCDTREVNPFKIAHDIPFIRTESFGKETSAQLLQDIEGEHIEKTLVRLNFNKSETARVLGIDRKTLRHKIKKYGIKDSELFDA